jgi:biopolymer transport protein TolQ
MPTAELPQIVNPDAANYSIVALFMQADMVVKAVMIGLALASLWSWAVLIDKWFQIGKASRAAKKFEDHFWSGKPLEELEDSLAREGASDPMGRMFLSGAREWRVVKTTGVANAVHAAEIRDRADRLMRASASREIGHLEKGVGILATIASSAPFIGLFGTVWGIMNAFRSIAATRETNLAVVAPGIAEALFATALGLVAAIPALMFYNKLVGDLDRMSVRLENIGDEIVVRLSRRLMERAGG